MTTEYVDGMQTAHGTLDFDGFTDKVKELLAIANISDDDITFMEYEPVGSASDEIEAPIITFDMHERVRSKTHKSLDPIPFGAFPDKDDPSILVKVFRMWFDVEIEFKVFHVTNRQSRLLMEAFENFLFTYKGYFKDQGISDIIFLAETKPTVESRLNRELSVRTLRYLVRIERVTTIRSNKLQEINAVAGGVNSDTPYVQDGRSMNVSNPFMDAYSSQFRTNE